MTTSKQNSRNLFRRTAYLTDELQTGRTDRWDLWLAVLKRLVEERNTRGQFDDILHHDEFRDIDTTGLVNILDGCSIAEISVLYEFLLASHDMASKRDKGQFFTPDDVARFLASRAQRLGPGTWLDPCCGIGNLAYWLIQSQPDPEQFLLTSMRFVDLDPHALISARTLMSVFFQNKEQNLFTRLEHSCRVGDFLADTLLEPPVFEGEFDYVLMNPPYVQSSAPGPQFESAPSRDMYAFFIERAIKTATAVVAITPQTFTNGRRHAALRDAILRYSDQTTIYCFDNVPDTVFKGFKFGSENTNRVNSTRAAVLVTQRSESGARRFRITPLIRWRASQRSRLWEEVDELLGSPINVDASHFPKVPPGLEGAYASMEAAPVRLADVASASPDNVDLRIPTTPRYFISAVRRHLDRSSMATLSIPDEGSKRLAYLTLNSSLAYFWWRVRDGGMTLSRATLMSLPLDDTVDVFSTTATDLIRRLEESEQANLVSKLNSGKQNENVKHPTALIRDLNEFLAPQHAALITELHRNSDLGPIS